MRYIPIEFYARPEGTVGFEIIVKGSNENRPKVLVGDCIRLRPVLEDCQLNLSTWLENVYTISVDTREIFVCLNMFEINAIVSYYDLRTEKVIVLTL